MNDYSRTGLQPQQQQQQHQHQHQQVAGHIFAPPLPRLHDQTSSIYQNSGLEMDLHPFYAPGNLDNSILPTQAHNFEDTIGSAQTLSMVVNGKLANDQTASYPWDLSAITTPSSSTSSSSLRLGLARLQASQTKNTTVEPSQTLKSSASYTAIFETAETMILPFQQQQKQKQQWQQQQQQQQQKDGERRRINVDEKLNEPCYACGAGSLATCSCLEAVLTSISTPLLSYADSAPESTCSSQGTSAGHATDRHRHHRHLRHHDQQQQLLQLPTVLDYMPELQPSALNDVFLFGADVLAPTAPSSIHALASTRVMQSQGEQGYSLLSSIPALQLPIGSTSPAWFCNRSGGSSAIADPQRLLHTPPPPPPPSSSFHRQQHAALSTKGPCTTNALKSTKRRGRPPNRRTGSKRKNFSKEVRGELAKLLRPTPITQEEFAKFGKVGISQKQVRNWVSLNKHRGKQKLQSPPA